MTRPYYVALDVTHLEHHHDGYPLCWPMTAEGEHHSTKAEADVTCPDCLKHLSDQPTKENP